MQLDSKQYFLFVPGRLCLSGEHSDWAGGYRTANESIIPGIALTICFQTQGISAVVKFSTKLELSSTQFGNENFEIDSLLTHARSPSPWRYAAAVAHVVHTRYSPPASVSVQITESTLPASKGFSSSAAICVLIARAYTQIYSIPLSTSDEMDLAYVGERLTGSACGRMDQVVALAPGTVACMHFDGDSVDHKVVTVGKEGREKIFIVVADLGGEKNTVRILEALQKGFDRGLEKANRKLVDALGKKNMELVTNMKKALELGDAGKLGALMTEAQKIFDEAAQPLCPEQLTSPRLHQTLRDDQILSLVYGGKGVGSQGDGAVQFVAKNEMSANELKLVLNQKFSTEAYVIALG